MQSNRVRKISHPDATIGIIITASAVILVLSLSAAVGMADFDTSSTTQSLVGTRIVSDTSYTFSQSGLYLAQSGDAGAASSTSAQEIDAVKPTLRTNAVTSGNFAYKVELTEASELSSGTWTVKMYQDGSQVGSTMTLTQASAVAGTTEGATIVADLGTSVATTTLFEVRITKTG